MLLDRCCLVCRTSIGPICAACAERLRPAVPGRRLIDAADGLCASSLIAYEGVGRDLVTSIKYRNGRRLVDPLGPLVAELAAGLRPEIVTWVPASRPGRQARGYDQGKLLGRAVGRHLGVPVKGLLRRTGGPPQTGRPASERAMGPHLACRRGSARVLIVDDVVTTGASLAAAGRALSDQGWQPVGAVTIAATPRRVGSDATPFRASPTAAV